MGELYQPDSLTSFVQCWQRIISSRGSKIDIKKDIEFSNSRKVLAARRKRLVNQGMGNKPCATRPLSVCEVDKLYAAGYFGITSPLSLQRNIWWLLTVSCSFRGRDESRKLKLGDIKLSLDSDTNQSFLEWSVLRGSKTFSGEMPSHSHQRSYNPPIYETGSERCPVKIYNIFLSHRPQESLGTDAPFFLAMIPQEKIVSNTWYYNRPLGKNKLGEFLSNTASILGQESNSSRSKISNHSARKTSITTLLNNNVHPLHVMQLSGHKNIESLNHYNVASKQQQRNMSNILNHAPSSSISSASNDNGSGFRDRSPIRLPPSNQLNVVKDDGIGNLFYGATLTNNTININITQHIQQPRKKKYTIFDSDEDE